jgi:hypothetical protein
MSVQVEATPPRLDKTTLRQQRRKMSVKRKRVTPPNSQQLKNLQANGLYVHSSPPRGQYRSLLNYTRLESLYSVIEYTKLLTGFFGNYNGKRHNEIKFNKSLPTDF